MTDTTRFTEEMQALLDSDRDNEGGCFNTGLEPGFVPVRLRGITEAFATCEEAADAYTVCFKALRYGHANLAEIQSIAWNVARIEPGIIQLRMSELAKMVNEQ